MAFLIPLDVNVSGPLQHRGACKFRCYLSRLMRTPEETRHGYSGRKLALCLYMSHAGRAQCHLHAPAHYPFLLSDYEARRPQCKGKSSRQARASRRRLRRLALQRRAGDTSCDIPESAWYDYADCSNDSSQPSVSACTPDVKRGRLFMFFQ